MLFVYSKKYIFTKATYLRYSKYISVYALVCFCCRRAVVGGTTFKNAMIASNTNILKPLAS